MVEIHLERAPGPPRTWALRARLVKRSGSAVGLRELSDGCSGGSSNGGIVVCKDNARRLSRENASGPWGSFDSQRIQCARGWDRRLLLLLGIRIPMSRRLLSHFSLLSPIQGSTIMIRSFGFECRRSLTNSIVASNECSAL